MENSIGLERVKSCHAGGRFQLSYSMVKVVTESHRLHYRICVSSIIHAHSNYMGFVSSTSLSICLSVCMSVLSVSLSVCLSVCLYVSLSDTYVRNT